MDLALAAAVAGVIVGGIAALISYWTAVTQRRIDVRHHTMDFLSQQSLNPEFRQARQEFRLLAKNNNGDLAGFADASFDPSAQLMNILTVLNQYEIMAIAIQHGVLDADLFKQFWRSQTVLVWDTSESFIKALRTRLDNELLFSEFQALARSLK